MGGVFGKESSSESSSPSSKLESKMREAMQIRAQYGSTIRSFNHIILKFPRIEKSLTSCTKIFQDFDKESNGLIDRQELKHFLEELKISLDEQEMDELVEASGIGERAGMKFHEFVVFLCLVYLLQRPSPEQAKSVSEISNLETAYEIMLDAFVFMDRDRDGYVNREEMVRAMSESDSYDCSPESEALKRFEEMDWDHNGMVSFKEFVFACIRWLGLDDEDEDDAEIDPNELR